LIAHAKSDEGVFLRSILVETGMSINEWNDLDPRQQLWWIETTNEHRRREKRAIDHAKRRR